MAQPDAPDAVLYAPTVGAVRIPDCAWKTQYVQPVFALSEKTSPLSLATNRRPPTTTGCARTEVTPGSPKAHLSVSRGTSGAVMPPLSDGTNRVFVSPPPQPFQLEPLAGSVIGGTGPVHRPTFEIGAGVPNARPATNSATARFSAPVR